MRNWELKKLGEIADVKLSNVDKKTNADERVVRLCNYTDVYKNQFINSEKATAFIVASCNEAEFQKFILRKGQVAITKDSEKRDDIGISTYISESFDDVVLGYHLSLITPNEGELNGQFLNYWFNTTQAKKYFENNAGGSGQRFTLPLDIIKNISIELPDLITQQKIAAVLSSLDNKIELNNRINAELEAMAKTLYDYWFVQFDFPDAEGKPYKSSGGRMVYNETLKRETPQGWEIMPIGQILEKPQRTISIETKDYLIQGRYPIVDQSSDFIAGFTSNDNSVIKASQSPQIVFGDHTRILKFINFDFARGADGTQILKSKLQNLPQHLFYFSLLKIDLSNYGYARHFKFLKEQLVLLPKHEVSERFENIVKAAYNSVGANQKQNQHLANLRDWLLTMLMNRQISVGEAYEHTEVLSMAAE